MTTPRGSQSAARVFLCPPSGPPVRWQPPVPPSDSELPSLGGDFRQDLVYVGRILARVLDQSGEPLTIYVTRDVTQELPSVGPDVVAVVLADEYERIPAYADSVRAVFKRYGTAPHLYARPRESSLRLTALQALQWGHKWARNLPARTQLARSRHRWSVGDLPVHVFPLGYFRQDELPITPIEDRPYDVLFYGSSMRAAPRGIRRVTGTVKGVSRATMLRQAAHLRRVRPDLRVELVTTDSFGAAPASAEPYSDALMRSKLCLSPAGNSPETYRNYEAWRYGAVPVTEGLPPLWFHGSSPHLRVRPDWADLEAVVDSVLGDPARLRGLHEASLAHWRDVVSEAAVAAWMLDRIAERS